MKNFRTSFVVVFVLLANLINGQIILPVEVLGSSGLIKTINVDVTNPTTIKGIWMVINNLSYENKASVKINNGTWIDLNNTTTGVSEPAKSYGGIGGGHHVGSIKLTLTVAGGAFVAGKNSISFRFNTSDGVSIGFRVVKLNLVDANGKKLIPSSAFAEEDPNSWTQPIAGAAAAAAGKSLWETKNITEGALSTVVLIAKCGDCHAKNGRDLKYFNYSNTSIIERSKFHGMTELEGQQVASYIRSLNVPNPGRPWNPPYQPGPGLDSKPINEWAAGAGLDWVLDKDELVFPFMFPNGIDTSSISLNKVLNVRETPVMLQFPDWNHWLPTIHPYDASFGGDKFINSGVNYLYSGEGTYTGKNYNLTTRIEAGPNATLPSGPPYRSVEGLANDLATFKGLETEFLRPLNEDLFAPSPVVWSKKYADEIYSLRLWAATKQWELINGNDLEGMGKTLYGSKAEERSWPGLFRHVYDVSPHLAKIPREDFTSHNLKKINQIYHSNIWYHVQPVLSSGNNKGGGHSVVDWEYSHGNLNDLRKGSSNISMGEPGRMIINFVKQMQQKHASGIGPEDAWSGWDLLRDHNVFTMVFWDSKNVWDGIDLSLKRELMNAVLWVWYTKSASYPASQYQRQLNGNYPIEPATVVPQNKINGGNSADILFSMIPLFRAENVDCELLNKMAVLGSNLWPLGAWNTLTVTCPVVVYPKINITSPTNAMATTNSYFTVNATASIPTGSISKVEFYNHKTLVGTDNAAPYTMDFTNLEPGSYFIMAKAYDQTGNFTATDTRMVNITEPVIAKVPATSLAETLPFIPLTVYPNPTRQATTLYFNKLTSFKLYNLVGIVVGEAQSTKSFDLHTISKGIYILKSTDNEVIKIIID